MSSDNLQIESSAQTIRRSLKHQGESFAEFWRRFRKNRAAVLGLSIVIAFSSIAILAPVISPYNPFDIHIQDFTQVYLPPDNLHPMGTDQLGRDVLSRIIWGARVSLMVGLAAAAISAAVGMTLGAVAGYYSGRIDNAIMRFVDMFLTIPTFFLILTIVAIFGGSLRNVMLVIGLTIWPSTARLMRAEFLSFREKEFVQAARSIGAGDRHIMFREIAPNAIFPAIVNGSLQVGSAILTESALSFLGLGDPNNVSWGFMLNDALGSFLRAWWLSVFPGIMITLVVVAFNLIGDGLNDALNPFLKER
ncbi:MAG TPA: ABC transporter permease [Candidatus Bathyarchaeia archaeon]|nr:ABC transporter permease [Candidatus Bathyarchaeia archaeon]